MNANRLDPVKQISDEFAFLLEQRFTKKMNNSIQGIDSCICQEETDLDKLEELEGKTIAVTDIGGSFVKIQIFKVQDGKVKSLGKLDKCFHEHEKKLSVGDLANEIVSHIRQLLFLVDLDRVDRYAETFSFPAQVKSLKKKGLKQVYIEAQDDLGKGWLVEGLSEVKWTQYIVDTLYKNKLIREKSTVSINDTVAVLLALLKRKNANTSNILAGVVMGTGFNMAMFDNDGVLRNLEAAWADISLPDVYARSLEKYFEGIDQHKKSEVQVGGGFGVPVIGEQLKNELKLNEALVEAWFEAGKKYESQLLSWTIDSPDKLSAILEEFGRNVSYQEFSMLRERARDFYGRSSQVVAGMLLGIAKYKQYKQGETVTFGLNGSVGLKAPNVKDSILSYIDAAGYMPEVVDLPESTLEGPVVAGLCV